MGGYRWGRQVYMGDYAYMGDPGLFSFVKKAFKGVAKVAGGALGLGGGGGAASVVHCPAAAATAPVQTDPYRGFMDLLMMQQYMGGGRRRRSMFLGDPGLWDSIKSGIAGQIPGGLGALQTRATDWLRANPGAAAALSGLAGLGVGGIGGAVLRGGAGRGIAATGPGGMFESPIPWGQTPRALALAAAGMGRRRYRRMNITNPRALRRAHRRMKAFAKFARSVIRTERAYKPKPRFSRRRRARR